jgi:hypothetical protein
MLTEIRTRSQARLSELSRAYFMHHAGYSHEPGMAAIVRRYDDLLAPTVQGAIRQAWEQATDPVEKQQLGYLYGDCLRNVLRRDLAEPGDALGKAEAKAEVAFEGERISYPQASMAIGRTADRAKRKALAAATREVTAALNAPRVALLEAEHRLIMGEVGFPSYEAFYKMVRGLDFAGLGPQLERFLADTAELYHRMMGDWSREVFGLPHTELESHDIVFLRRAASFDQYFPGDKLVPTLQGTLRDLGIAPEGLTNVTMDLDNRPGKSSRAFCMGVRIPEEVYLCITPGGGADDYQSLLHEMGHALHFGHADAEMPFEFRFMGDNSVCEGFAFNFEHLTLEPAWLKAHTGMDDAAIAAYRQHMYRLYLFNLRRFAAKHLFELQLHDGGPVADKGAIYAALLTEHLGVRYFAEDFLAGTDGGFYTAQYFRAWCLEAQLKRVLKSRFGDAWFQSAEAGAFMRDLWRRGQSLPGDELVRQVVGEELSAHPVMDEISAVLAG